MLPIESLELTVERFSVFVAELSSPVYRMLGLVRPVLIGTGPRQCCGSDDGTSFDVHAILGRNA